MDQGNQLSLIPEEWTYLAEGNLHVILRYKGPNPSWSDKILRINKVEPSGNLENDSIIYNRLANQPYLSSDTCSFKEVLMSEDLRRDFISSVATFIENLRPSNRRERELDRNSLIFVGLNLFHSYSQLEESFSFEIKPKSDQPLWAVGAPNEISKFFLVQLQKIEKQEGKDLSEIPLSAIAGQLSQYDPYDLFVKKSLKAIAALFATPQNNFKLFLKGKELTYPYQSEIWNAEAQYLVHKVLVADGLLDRIREMTSKNTSTIENILEIWQEVKDIDISQEIMDQVLSNEHPTSPLVEKIRKVCNFMLMVTWSDISIIGTIAKVQGNLTENIPTGFTSTLVDGQTIWYRLSVVDYEIKPPQKLFEYAKQATQLQQLLKKYQAKLISS